MAHWIARAPASTIFCTVVATIIILAVAVAPGALAQTMTEPNSQKKLSAPPVAAKSLPNARAKRCSMYGDGFVYVPASDTCIKIGGSVTMDGVTTGR